MVMPAVILDIKSQRGLGSKLLSRTVMLRIRGKLSEFEPHEPNFG